MRYVHLEEERVRVPLCKEKKELVSADMKLGEVEEAGIQYILYVCTWVK